MIASETIISPCERYRYQLYRDIGPESRPCAFMMLNPSTADHTEDDPTLRRCMGYAKQWGCGDLWVVNLFAIRGSKPSIIKEVSNPVGELNRYYVKRIARHISAMGGVFICGWGNHGTYNDQDLRTLKWVTSEGVRPKCLKISKNGNPCHPLYLSKDLAPQVYLPRA